MIDPAIEIKNIFYATDLSESARYAFAYAVSLSEKYGARLTLCHVISEDPNLDERVIGYISGSQWEKIKQRHDDDAREAIIGKAGARRVIGEVLDRFYEDARGATAESDVEKDEILVVRGNPAEQILAQSKEKNCDLIVMGTHGIGGFAGAMMGSTAQRVLRRSAIPVLVIRLPDE